MSGHTPGPWRAEPQGAGARGHWLHDDSGDYIAMCCSRGSRDEEDANARLIAAAPDLLEALEKLINFYADYLRDEDGYEILPAYEQRNEHIAAAMRIYAKATGAA